MKTLIILFLLISLSFAQGVTDSLYAWFRSDVGITLGDSGITDWANQYGNGSDMTTSAGKDPDVIANGLGSRQTIVFDGSVEHFFESPSNSYDWMHKGIEFTVFILAKFSTSNPDALENFMGTTMGSGGNIGFTIGLDDRSGSSRNLGFIIMIVGTATDPFNVYTGDDIVSNIDEWHTYTFRHNRGSQYKIYFDNDSVWAADSTANSTYSSAGATRDFGIGVLNSDGISSWFGGEIAEIRIYNRALDNAEMTIVYNNMQSYWYPTGDNYRFKVYPEYKKYKPRNP